MERVLEKMAKQLNVYDEASLMELWNKYAARVHDFEPTQQWEQACLIFCMIQSIRWKNQLFNYHLKQSTVPEQVTPPSVRFHFTQQEENKEKTPSPKKKARILPFSSK